ncbi:MAG: C4-dicarboxylate transporter DctA [Candidatus Rokuibacteriota bacterium]|nr:MAG: C4-dicarboxylate transporter DctA [Candidatus Rokubacteria bacterium]
MAASPGRPFHRALYGQVLVATGAGVIVGHFWPSAGVAMAPLGEAFIRLVRMIVAPIIFCTVVAGIAGAGDVKTVGKTGIVALVYFELVTTLALILGLLAVNLVRPGAGMNVDVARLDAAGVRQYATAGGAERGWLVGLIPSSAVDAFAKGDVLQVLVVSVLFGFALRSVRTGGPLFALIEASSRVLFRVVDIVMATAPIGAFGAMAFTVGSFGVGTLVQLGGVIACFYATCALFIAGVIGAIARAHGFSVWRFIGFIREEILVVWSTSSSEAALPRLMEKLEDLGVGRSVVGLVIPAGYSFNLDGTAIYLSIATVFIAQATNTPLTVPQQIALLAILLISSKGSAGVAGAALVVLTATLSATGRIPVAGVALVLGIHRFMGEAMAVTNLIGNGVAAIVIGRWCGDLDAARLVERLRARDRSAAPSGLASA